MKGAWATGAWATHAYILAWALGQDKLTIAKSKEYNKKKRQKNCHESTKPSVGWPLKISIHCIFIFICTILKKYSFCNNFIYLFIFKIIIKLIMTSSQFDLGLTLKTLNLYLLRFNERFGFENLGLNMALNSLSPFLYGKINK